jgi:hypothetical protein
MLNLYPHPFCDTSLTTSNFDLEQVTVANVTAQSAIFFGKDIQRE